MTKKGKSGTQFESAKLKIGDLMRPEFQLAMSDLMNQNDLPIETSWALLQVSDTVEKHQKQFEELRHKLLERFGQKDAEGKLVMNGTKTAYVLADQIGFDHEYSALVNLKVDVPQIPLSAIKVAKLSPAKLSTLVKTIVSPNYDRILKDVD